MNLKDIKGILAIILKVIIYLSLIACSIIVGMIGINFLVPLHETQTSEIIILMNENKQLFGLMFLVSVFSSGIYLSKRFFNSADLPEDTKFK